MKGNLGYWQRRYIRIHGYDPGIFALAKRAKRVTLSFEGCLFYETGGNDGDGGGGCCCCWFRKVILSGPLITRPSQIFKQAGPSPSLI
ncbi:hypothetical protein V1478_017343, partial [Vespula squamosa]